ncbi:MAG: hypothetical protein V1658_03950 [Candidatus Micrarchaeota archaeon]
MGIARAVREHYAKTAHWLNMYGLASELESAAFRTEHPWIAKQVGLLIKKKKESVNIKNRRASLMRIAKSLSFSSKEPVQIEYRIKSDASAWKKMKIDPGEFEKMNYRERKRMLNRQFKTVRDVIAFRLIVPDGYTDGKPNHELLKNALLSSDLGLKVSADYFLKPKPNHYRRTI